jgi:hypothetical protein
MVYISVYKANYRTLISWIHINLCMWIYCMSQKTWQKSQGNNWYKLITSTFQIRLYYLSYRKFPIFVYMHYHFRTWDWQWLVIIRFNGIGLFPSNRSRNASGSDCCYLTTILTPLTDRVFRLLIPTSSVHVSRLIPKARFSPILSIFLWHYPPPIRLVVTL